MQALIAIRDTPTLNLYEGRSQALTRKVCGVPLLVLVIKTVIRAGTNSLLVLWPADVPQSIWISTQLALVEETVCGIVIIQSDAFDPRQSSNWEALSGLLDDQFLWLPWNWVTNKKALAGLKPAVALPPDWNLPIHLTKDAAVHDRRVPSIESRREGVAVYGRFAKDVKDDRAREGLAAPSPHRPAARPCWPHIKLAVRSLSPWLQ